MTAAPTTAVSLCDHDVNNRDAGVVSAHLGWEFRVELQWHLGDVIEAVLDAMRARPIVKGADFTPLLETIDAVVERTPIANHIAERATDGSTLLVDVMNMGINPCLLIVVQSIPIRIDTDIHGIDVIPIITVK